LSERSVIQTLENDPKIYYYMVQDATEPGIKNKREEELFWFFQGIEGRGAGARGQHLDFEGFHPPTYLVETIFIKDPAGGVKVSVTSNGCASLPK